MRIGVSLLPLESLVQEIGGDTVEVRSLQREGDSCSVFEPRPSSIGWLADARIFFRIGAGYESVIIGKLQAQYPQMRVIDLRESVQTVQSGHPVAAGHDHAHDHEHECDACGLQGDPHIWLDPVRLVALADRVAVELGNHSPGNRQRYASAAREFARKLQEVDSLLAERLQKHQGKAFFIYHPALGYFADRYQLRQVAIAQSSQGPTVKQLHALISQARSLGVRTIFVQPQESKRHAQIIADAIGADVVEIDPMSTGLIANLLHIGDSLAASFSKE